MLHHKERINIIETPNTLEIQIKAEPTWFLIFLLSSIAWVLLGIFANYFLAIVLMNFIIVLVAAILWFTAFLLFFFLSFWHLCGVEIIRIDNKQLFISRKVKALRYRKTFDIKKVSRLSVTTFREKLFMGFFEFSWNDLSVYPGNIGFDYKGNTYHFAFQIEHNDAVDICSKINEYLDNLRSKQSTQNLQQ